MKRLPVPISSQPPCKKKMGGSLKKKMKPLIESWMMMMMIQRCQDEKKVDEMGIRYISRS